MITIEFYWNDLTEKKQKEIIDLIGDNNNWDVFPIATLDIEEDVDNDYDPRAICCFYDPISGKYFSSCEMFILNAEDQINKFINSIGMEANINDWYDELKLPHISFGEYCGWNIDNMLKIEIGELTKSPTGIMCRPIKYINLPVDYQSNCTIKIENNI